MILQFQIVPVNLYLMVLGAHMNVLFILKIEVLGLIEWLYRSL